MGKAAGKGTQPGQGTVEIREESPKAQCLVSETAMYVTLSVTFVVGALLLLIGIIMAAVATEPDQLGVEICGLVFLVIGVLMLIVGIIFAVLICTKVVQLKPKKVNPSTIEVGNSQRLHSQSPRYGNYGNQSPRQGQNKGFASPREAVTPVDCD